MKYSNPAWEPYFEDIMATMIFKKMSFLEWRNEHWT